MHAADSASWPVYHSAEQSSDHCERRKNDGLSTHWAPLRTCTSGTQYRPVRAGVAVDTLSGADRSGRCYYFAMSRNNEEGIFDALANSNRRRILQFLRDKDFVRAGDIARDLEIGHSTLSAHLKVLRHADLVVSRRQGTEIHYRANLTVIEEAIVALSRLRRDDAPQDPPTRGKES